MFERRTKRILLAAIIVAWGLVYLLQASIGRKAARLHSGNPYVAGLGEGGTIAILASLGGFRGMAANLLWVKADEYFHTASGWWRVMPTLQAVTQLDPHFVDAWELLAWHIGYNMYVAAAPADRPSWAQSAIDCYREALRANANTLNAWRLRQALAWYYQDRLMDHYKAIPEWIQVTQMPGGLSSPYQVLHPLAHCYEETWQITKAVEVWKRTLKLDREDTVAQSAIEWWSKHKNDRFYLRKLLAGKNVVRQQRDLRPMAPPYDLNTEPVR
jgi:tetratricopeptide (TPR) repeat protein